MIMARFSAFQPSASRTSSRTTPIPAMNRWANFSRPLRRTKGTRRLCKALPTDERVILMRLVTKCFGAIVILVLWLSFASAQTEVKKPVAPNVTSSSTEQTDAAASEASAATTPTVWIHLVGGRRMQVDDVTQVADGIWYTRSNVSTFLDSASVVRIE